MGVVYKITNTINGKIYIGYTMCSFANRMGHHKHDDYKYNTLLGKDIKKYGWDKFKPEIIAEEDSKEKLLELERYYIKFFNSKSPNGYNMTPGGEKLFGADNPFWGRTHSDETRKLLSEINKKKVGEKNPFYGKHHSEETKQRLRECNSRPVLAIDKDGNVVKRFSSQVEAGEWCRENKLSNIKFINSEIARRCKDGKMEYGYFWRYEDEGVETNPDECKDVE